MKSHFEKKLSLKFDLEQKIRFKIDDDSRNMQASCTDLSSSPYGSVDVKASWKLYFKQL